MCSLLAKIFTCVGTSIVRVYHVATDLNKIETINALYLHANKARDAEIRQTCFIQKTKH